MNASSIEGTQLAGVSNVALASLQVALVQQAQFKQTLEEIAARIREDERAAASAKADASARNSAPGGTRAIEKADSGAQAGSGGNPGDKQTGANKIGGGSVSAPSGSLNIRV